MTDDPRLLTVRVQTADDMDPEREAEIAENVAHAMTELLRAAASAQGIELPPGAIKFTVTDDRDRHGQVEGQESLIPDPRTTTEVVF